MVDELSAQGLVSDRRYVASYVDERMRKGFGPLRIRAELQERGIGGDLVSHGLAVDEDVWLDLLRRVHDKKFGNAAPHGRADAARRARFLEYRGFTSAQVSRVLRFDD